MPNDPIRQMKATSKGLFKERRNFHLSAIFEGISQNRTNMVAEFKAKPVQ